MDEMNLAARYRNWADEDLAAICTAPEGDYTAVAVATAREELAVRGFSAEQLPIALSVYGPLDPMRPRPWARFFARQIDFLLLVIPWMLFWRMQPSNNSLLMTVTYWVSWLLLEPLLLSTFGTTPGKAVFRLYVEDHNGYLLKYERALGRTVGVFIAGLGLGLPLIGLFTMEAARKRLVSTGSTQWDDGSATRVRTDTPD